MEKTCKRFEGKVCSVIISIGFVLICLFLTQGCKPEKIPVVSTGEVYAITDTSARCNGNVADNGAVILVRGVCYDTIHLPEINGPHTSDGSGFGDFHSDLKNLQPNTTYYVRAYAGNGNGITYGDEVVFSTTSGGEPAVDEDPMTLLTIPQGWKMTSVVSSPAYCLAINGVTLTELFADGDFDHGDGYFYECEKDDIIVFSNDGTHRLLPDSIFCEYGWGYTQETELGQWHFDNDANPTYLYYQLPFFYNDDYSSYDAPLEACQIIVLSRNMLKVAYLLDFEQKRSKGAYVFTITYVPAE